MGRRLALTIRQRIIELLKNGEHSARDLSKILSIREKEVYEHLTHVQRSLGSGVNIITQPPRCLDCGFVFTDRKRFTAPGKCPKCRSEGITAPVYGVELKAGKSRKSSREKSRGQDPPTD